jgi:hypothetical protein
MDVPSILPGKRLGIFGRSGSGKTYLTRWFMLRTAYRWVVLDTKHDPEFNDWRPSRGLLPMADIWRSWKRDNHMVVVRPKPEETNPAMLDAYLGMLHEAFENFGVSMDETYHFSTGPYPGPGMIGLLTRGRARKQAVITGAQRPKRLPLFILSEANAFAILNLTMAQDRALMADMTDSRALLDRIPVRDWFYYSVDEGELGRYGPVTIRD